MRVLAVVVSVVQRFVFEGHLTQRGPDPAFVQECSNIVLWGVGSSCWLKLSCLLCGGCLWVAVAGRTYPINARPAVHIMDCWRHLSDVS